MGQGVRQIGAEGGEDTVHTVEIRLAALVEALVDARLQALGPAGRLLDKAGAQVAAVVPQGCQVTAHLGAGQPVAARVEGAVQDLMQRVLGNAVPAKPHAGDEDLLMQTQATAPYQHQAGHGGGAGVLQPR